MRYLLFFYALFSPSLLYVKPFKVATYNVQNLFDAKYNGTEYEAYIPYTKHNWTKRTVEIKLNRIAEVICDIDADIIGLQEIENQYILKQLFKRLEQVGCAYKAYAITRKKSAPIQVALLSRYPILSHHDIVVSSSAFVRNILQAKIDIQGIKLDLFVNHWKSKAYGGVESKRIAYAKALERAIHRLPLKSEYIILGDLNSNYDAYVTLEEKQNDTAGVTALNHILQTTIADRLVDVYDMKVPVQGRHYSLWSELPITQRWSHNFYGKKSSLDHIVVPTSMFDGKGIDYLNRSFQVFRASYLFTKRGYINAWRYKKGKHRAKGYSDHLPVYAYFDTQPYQYEKRVPKAKRQVGTIEDLYQVERLPHEYLLKNALVIFKRGNHALIKQGPKGRGILLFGCAGELEEGRSYDIVVQAIKNYYGLQEVTAAYIVKKGIKKSRTHYYQSMSYPKENEAVRDIVGTYKEHYLYSHGHKIPIHFRNQKLVPPNGSTIKILYALIGYYKKRQLVIYHKKDFTIVE